MQENSKPYCRNLMWYRNYIKTLSAPEGAQHGAWPVD